MSIFHDATSPRCARRRPRDSRARVLQRLHKHTVRMAIVEIEIEMEVGGISSKGGDTWGRYIIDMFIVYKGYIPQKHEHESRVSNRHENVEHFTTQHNTST